ncbi:MAG: hypothetical protein Kow002_11340 [Anaerolineales bacterium]
MNTDKVYLVILLVLGIVIFSNLAMFALVRGSKGMKFDWLKNVSGFNQSLKAQDDSLTELRDRVGKFEKDEADETKEMQNENRP